MDEIFVILECVAPAGLCVVTIKGQETEKTTVVKLTRITQGSGRAER